MSSPMVETTFAFSVNRESQLPTSKTRARVISEVGEVSVRAAVTDEVFVVEVVDWGVEPCAPPRCPKPRGNCPSFPPPVSIQCTGIH